MLCLVVGLDCVVRVKSTIAKIAKDRIGIYISSRTRPKLDRFHGKRVYSDRDDCEEICCGKTPLM
jgi:hypothetical protein